MKFPNRLNSATRYDLEVKQTGKDQELAIFMNPQITSISIQHICLSQTHQQRAREINILNHIIHSFGGEVPEDFIVGMHDVVVDVREFEVVVLFYVSELLTSVLYQFTTVVVSSVVLITRLIWHEGDNLGMNSFVIVCHWVIVSFEVVEIRVIWPDATHLLDQIGVHRQLVLTTLVFMICSYVIVLRIFSIKSYANKVLA
jgi:hypothetical protein